MLLCDFCFFSPYLGGSQGVILLTAPPPPFLRAKMSKNRGLACPNVPFMSRKAQQGRLCGLVVMFALYYILLGMQRGGSIEI